MVGIFITKREGGRNRTANIHVDQIKAEFIVINVNIKGKPFFV